MTTQKHLLLFLLVLFLFTTLAEEQAMMETPSSLYLNHTATLWQAEKMEAMTALEAVKLLDHQYSPPSYIFTLYHRDMFAENQSESSLLEERIARHISRSRYIASVFGSHDHDRNNSKLGRQPVPTTSSVSFASSGEYVVSFWVGSNRERSLLLLDTASPLVWWQCGPCDPGKCYQQANNPVYDSASSTTFQQVSCTLEPSSCADLPGNVLTCSAQSCDYQVRFGSDHVTKGFMAHENITFIIGQGSARIEFGCGKDQTSGKQFDGLFNGILGVGGGLFPGELGRYSLPTQLGTNLFSFCLPTPSLPSLVYFGTAPFIDGRRYTIEASMFGDHNLQSFYFLQLVSLEIGGSRYSVDQVESSGDLGSVRAFVETGSPWTQLPAIFYTAVSDKIKQMFLDKPYKNPPPFGLCYESEDVKLSDFPTVGLIFKSGSGNSLPLPLKDVAVAYKGYNCLSILPVAGSYAFIGGNHLQGHQVTIDIASERVTFTPGVCG